MLDLQSLVRTMADLAAELSSLAIDFAEPARARSVVSRLLLSAMRAGTAVMGERIVTLLTGSEATELLVDGGWRTVTLDPGPASLAAVFAAARIQ